MLLVPCLLGCFTRFPHFECSVFRSLLHCSVRLLAHPIVSKLKPTKSTAQYCYACLAAGQHQFRALALELSSSAGSRLGPLNRHCRFGGARWAHLMIPLPRRKIKVVSMILCSLVRIARDRFCRLQPNLCLLKMPF